MKTMNRIAVVILAGVLALSGCAPSLSSVREDASGELAAMSGLSEGLKGDFQLMIDRAPDKATIKRYLEEAMTARDESVARKEQISADVEALFARMAVEQTLIAMVGPHHEFEDAGEQTLVLNPDGSIEAGEWLIEVLGGSRWERGRDLSEFFKICDGDTCETWRLWEAADRESGRLVIRGPGGELQFLPSGGAQ